MRRLQILIMSFLVFVLQVSAQVHDIEISTNGDTRIIPTTLIDSITFRHDGTSYKQYIWHNGCESKMDVNDVEHVSFLKNNVTYNNFTAKEYGIENGLINSIGQYAIVGKDTISNNGAVILIGDINNGNPQITVHVDSLKLIRYVCCDSLVSRYLYGEDDLTILTLNKDGDSISCKIYTYNELKRIQTKARRIYRAGGTISNSGWFELFSLVDLGLSINSPTLSGWASLQHNPYLSFVGDVGEFAKGNLLTKALILLKWFDNIWSAYVFKGASIQTLPHEELSIDAVRLKCNIMGLETIPRIKNLEASALCSMKMRAVSGISGAPSNQYMKWEVQERDINKDGEQHFDFSNLLLESQYEYYPQLNLVWTEAKASIWVKISDDVIPDIDDWKVVTEEHRNFQSIRGEEGIFFTAKPIVTTEDPYYVEVTSATVGCVFANVPDNALYGIEYSDGNEKKTVSASVKEGESFPILNGLQPNTNYTYRAYVQTKYKTYYGKEKSFKTKFPSCSTGDLVSATDKSAVVKCYYADVEEVDVECGVMISSDNDTRKITTSRTGGKHEISLSGLSPATTYNYWAYVELDGNPINGEVKSFTTNPPDISGTWTCTEEYYFAWDKNYENPQYKDYPIILGKDGTVSIDGKSDYISSSWSYEANGRLTIKVMNMATSNLNSGFDINLTADEAKIPKKFTGAINNWSFNSTVGYVSRGGHSVVLTR